jgi:UDP-N-acetylglucosamine transferase subunit ALG13
MKVFLVVGTLFPFDRLVKVVDDWAGTNKEIKVTGQVGRGKYQTAHIETHEKLVAQEFNRVFEESDLIIAHAGMGIILKSLVANKPIIVLPRRLELKEHTTNHQVDTALAFEKLNYIHIAWDVDQLKELLAEPGKIQSKKEIGEYASDSLIEAIREFIEKN